VLFTNIQNEVAGADYDFSLCDNETCQNEKEDLQELLLAERLFQEEVERAEACWSEDVSVPKIYNVFEQIKHERYTRPPYLSQVRSPLIERTHYLEQFFSIPIDIESYNYWGMSDPIKISIWRLNPQEEKWDAVYHSILLENFHTMLYPYEPFSTEEKQKIKCRLEIDHPLILDFNVSLNRSEPIQNNNNNNNIHNLEQVQDILESIQEVSLERIVFPHPDKYRNMRCVPDDYFTRKDPPPKSFIKPCKPEFPKFKPSFSTKSTYRSKKRKQGDIIRNFQNLSIH